MTPSQLYGYKQWVDQDKPYIAGCNMPSPTPTTIYSSNPNPPLCGQSSIAPGYGVAPFTVLLHGAGSAGNGPGFSGYQWDFENDGVWDTGYLLDPVQHTYIQAGTYLPVYRVHGLNDLFSPLCIYPYSIVVLQSSGYLTPTPTPTPIGKRINWSYPALYVKADDMVITIDNKTFRYVPDSGEMLPTGEVGGENTIGLTRGWTENGNQLAIWFVFKAITTNLSYPPNGKEWLLDSVSINYHPYPRNSIMKEIRFDNVLASYRITGQYGYGWATNALTLKSNAGSSYPATIQFTNLELGAFLDRLTPTPTQTTIQCGGIRGLKCPSGYTCRFPDGSTRPPYPDATGVCRTDNPYPTPTCLPRPACMDPIPGQPQCMPQNPIGGWICPKTPTPTVSPTPTMRSADLNADLHVNLLDFNLLLRSFGRKGNPGFVKADINEDGAVNLFDFNILLQQFGV